MTKFASQLNITDIGRYIIMELFSGESIYGRLKNVKDNPGVGQILTLELDKPRDYLSPVVETFKIVAFGTERISLYDENEKAIWLLERS